MMQPLNYLRSATEELRSVWIPYQAARHPEDAASCESLLQVAAQSPKFLLPKGGRVLSDGLRGLPEELRLPFDSIVIEYQSNDGVGASELLYGRDNTYLSPKRIVVAAQLNPKALVVYSIVNVFVPGKIAWVMQPFFAAVRRAEPGEIEQGRAVHLQGTEVVGDPVQDLVVELCPTGTLAPSHNKEWERIAYVNMLDEVHAVLELIEALGCSNVTHEALPVRKQNKSAAARGALPFDEYRVLVVNARQQGRAGARGEIPHRSPREHLRRGHIRRLSDGRRLWINATVVNAGTKGKITRHYALRKEAA